MFEVLEEEQTSPVVFEAAGNDQEESLEAKLIRLEEEERVEGQHPTFLTDLRRRHQAEKRLAQGSEDAASAADPSSDESEGFGAKIKRWEEVDEDAASAGRGRSIYGDSLPTPQTIIAEGFAYSIGSDSPLEINATPETLPYGQFWKTTLDVPKKRMDTSRVVAKPKAN